MKTTIILSMGAAVLLSISANAQTFKTNRANRQAKRQANAQNIHNANIAIHNNNVATYQTNKNNRQAATADGVLSKDEVKATYQANAQNRRNTAKTNNSVKNETIESNRINRRNTFKVNRANRHQQ
ncbi:hypothetical protein A9P82_01290 [Arachidicoccus ginsenosidimutans]|uniref:hypothetical protein n=1 Tax=Arachidicoccus sp. BS20 TaxID=1850526 RepID=UPI0007F080AD|nr:hypothetical protein [Arachidicoccus sp. BS20]ANI88065.1 hypothetical protein A9P82_01290 [Arachidicoccus sp. BS20]